ncbi:hypothetical protein EON63_18815 [archaeon]|nr:MAG: hypothetical protein EON63_18815 [archaeon]
MYICMCICVYVYVWKAKRLICMFFVRGIVCAWVWYALTLLSSYIFAYGRDDFLVSRIIWFAMQYTCICSVCFAYYTSASYTDLYSYII